MGAPLRDPTLQLSPITELDKPIQRGAGQPYKYPPMPKLELNEAEQYLFDGYMSDILRLYPDINHADYRWLWLSATRFIMGLRLVNYEASTGRTITMSRQHPFVEMRALVDQLSVTRRARTRGTTDEDQETKDLRNALMSISSRR